jgi:hypothetical protein
MKIIGSPLPRLIKKYKGQSKPKPEALPTKYTFIPKSKTFKVNPKHTRLHGDPIAKRDMASSIARRTEARSHIALSKKVESGFLRTAYHKKLGQFPKLFKQRKRALARAFTLSQKRGMRALEKSSKKLDVNIKRFGVQGKGSRFTDTQWISAREAQELGFPPKVVSAEMKAFYAKQKPLAQAKFARKTLSKIYKQPKSWKKRSGLIRHYRGVAKTELQQAKMDRQILSDTTVQKLTGEKTFWRKGGYVSKPKKITKERWKTIRSKTGTGTQTASHYIKDKRGRLHKVKIFD